MDNDVTYRPATVDDLPAILGLVQELAAYEKEPDAVEATVESFRAVMFPDDGDPNVWAFVAELDGAVVGMCVWFLSFSTWTGRNGVWLEDLYVQPGHRGRGIATSLIALLATECVRRGLPRLDWTCLDWNSPALRLYDHLGARKLRDWSILRTTDDALIALADRAPQLG